MRKILQPDINIGRRLRYYIPLNVYFAQSHHDLTISIPILYQKLRVMALWAALVLLYQQPGAGGLKYPAILTKTLTDL